MSELPLVSVIAVCYNHAKYVLETLDSIKNQTYLNLELIIMDDCSTDNSVEVIKSWITKNDYDCQFIAHQKNQGLCKTLNESINFISGVYVQIISCDDILNPNKIKLQIELFNNLSTAYGVIHTDLNYINEKSEFIDRAKPRQRSNFKDEFYYKLIESNQIAAPTLLYKYQSILDVGKFDERYSFEDLDILLKLSKKYKIAYLDKCLLNYRILDTSLYRTRGIKGALDRIKIIYRNIEDEKSRKLANKNINNSCLMFLKKLKKDRNWSKYFNFFIQSLLYIPLKRSKEFKSYFTYFIKPFRIKIKFLTSI
jgi:glycosyltransferase involved in cell wall biosynthesis